MSSPFNESENQSVHINSHTVMYGVFGDPIKHSKSPIMLNRAFRECGINAAYTAYHVTPDRLGEAIAGIRALGFGGINVTIPHKVEVMRYLDEIDADAKAIGAVNTVVHRDGRLIGHNTDGIGYVRSLKEETGIRLSGKRILLLGAGGAARGVAYALAKETPACIWIANRTKDRAVDLADAMRFRTVSHGIGMDELDQAGEIDLIVNTTSSGMHPNVNELPVDEQWLNRRVGVGMTVSDLIYNPLETRLLALSAARGANTHSGLGMFIYQGAYAFEYWTGVPAPAAAMRDTVERALFTQS